MKLKGVELNGTYKVVYYDANFAIFDEKGDVIYSEYSNGYWSKREYNEKGNEIHFEDSNGYWSKSKYNEKGNRTYFEDSDDWGKWEYDKKGDIIYFENKNGIIIDDREKELTIEEIEKLLGYKIKIKGGRK